MLKRFLCAFLIAIFSTCSLFAADWVAFRGPDGNGKSPDTGLLKQWADGGPTLLWTVDFLGYGYSGVSISNNRIFITGNVERHGQALSMVFCLDMDGNKIWESDNGPAHTSARVYPGTRGTVAVEGNVAFDVTPLGQITCYDVENGNKIWSRNPLREYEAPMPMWRLGHSILIEGDYIIYPTGGPKHIAVALNKRTGETAWAAAPAGDGAQVGYTTPYAFTFEGTRVVTVMSTVTIEGFDATNGRKLFSIPWRNQLSCNCTMPIYHEGHLLASTGYRFGTKLFKLSKNTDGTITAEEQWFQPALDNQHGGILLIDGYVYGSAHQNSPNSWGAVNVATGEVGFITRRPGMGQGSVVYADGLIYGLSEDTNTVFLWQPNPNEFTVLSSFDLPNQVDGASWAHPVVIGGRLYVRHGTYLYCYDVRAR